MKRWLIVMGIVGGAFAGEVAATPYWVAWEGNDYPENEGWSRGHHDPDQQADRSLADGVMTLDGLASIEITDFYDMSRPLNPEPGEEFVMQWRLRVNELIANPLSPYDPGLNVFSDDDWALTFWIGFDRIRSLHEDVVIPFTPGVFHAFEVRSADMRTYELRIDGAVVYAGSWWEPTFRRSSVSWGDFIFGGASNSDWDYFRFGVVPEPTSCISLLALLCAVQVSNRTRRLS